MKFKGFTLSEVLITIGLIGVVAALTLPALMVDVQKQQAGPALLRAIATLDTANAIMVTEQDMYSFGDSCGGLHYKDCFENHIQRRIGAGSGDVTVNYQEFNGMRPAAHENDEDYVPIGEITGGYATKNGFIYYFDAVDVNAPDVRVRIDINGLKGPNMLGRDLFYAVISAAEDGKVYPWGSRVIPEGAPWEATNTWESGNCDSDNTRDPITCAGSIIDNGGKVIYK